MVEVLVLLCPENYIHLVGLAEAASKSKVSLKKYKNINISPAAFDLPLYKLLSALFSCQYFLLQTSISNGIF